MSDAPAKVIMMPVRLLKISESATGVIVNHERGQQEFTVEFYHGGNPREKIVMDVHTARMLRAALESMKVLE
jgi:hypothetical protein